MADTDQGDRDETAIVMGRFPKGALVAGKYRIEALLGQGGMGIVLRAHHETLDRTVAIKVLLAELAGDTSVVARFLREARALAKLESEHIVRVIDFGTLDDGSPFMVMEHLEGIDLGDLLARDGALPVQTAVAYVVQVLGALAEAHAIGIVHRDLKPANLFVTTKASGRSVVKLLDFGISKGSGGVADANLTSTKAMMGSPFYMSPEQIRATRDVDARSDVWSMGVVLYELVTGAKPFPGDTVGEVLSNVVEASPPTPRTVRPDLPLVLEAAILRCLRRNPDERFQSVSALAEGLAPLAPAATAASSPDLVAAAPDPLPAAGRPGPTSTTQLLETQTTMLAHASTATPPPPPPPGRQRSLSALLSIVGAVVIVVAITAIALVGLGRHAAVNTSLATPPPASASASVALLPAGDPPPASRATEPPTLPASAAAPPPAAAAASVTRGPRTGARPTAGTTRPPPASASSLIAPPPSAAAPRGEPLDIRN